MSCTSLRQVFALRGVTTRRGAKVIVWSQKEADASSAGYDEFYLPCGSCVSCRLAYSRSWAIRCMHEASLHDRNCFLTLTYSPAKVPLDHSLHLEHFQDFMKRYRYYFGNGIRFYHSGEYGDKFGRPHYHALIFGHDFEDKKFFKMSGKNKVFVSPRLNEIWGFGYCYIGTVTMQSAGYVARYCMKKVKGDAALEYYCTGVDQDTGEMFFRRPEYSTMSRREAIGKRFYEQFFNDIYPHGFFYVDGKRVLSPKYYDKLFAKDFPDLYDDLKIKRKAEFDESYKRQFGGMTDLQIAKRMRDLERIGDIKASRLVRVMDLEL